MSSPFSDIAIASAYNTTQARRLDGHTSVSISLEAVRGAVGAAGLAVDDIDGVFGNLCGEMVYHLGLGATTTTALDNVGISAVLEAANAVRIGLCDVAVVVSGGAGSYVDRTATAPWTRPPNEWVVPFGMYTAVEFALVAQRHMHLYGTKPEQLAYVAATIRNNGHANPEAVYFGRGPYTPRDVLDSRMVADPFHLLDCAMTSEGACAMVVTTLERARDCALPPVRLLGVGLDRLGPVYQHPPSWDLSAARRASENNGQVGRRAAARAFAQAGLEPADVDICELYDPFSFEVIRQFEAFGFCGAGEGGDFVSDGRIAPGGELPTTTDGGLLSFSHSGRAQMLQRVARGVHQVQGVCVSNQVLDAEVALCSNGGAGALFTDVMLLGAAR
jgi:acetyl-CoA acetyltransferase